MNSERRISPRSLFVLPLIVVTLLVLPRAIPLASAQDKASANIQARTQGNGSPDKSSARGYDNDYSKKIKEYTTEKFFLTELVDHPPMSDTVPSPDKVLGYIVGTPNKLTYSKDLYPQFNAGSFVIKSDGNPADVRQQLEAAVNELGLNAQAVDKLTEVKMHALAVPRIAILHSWTNTQNDGWYRIEFDRLQIPYTCISDQVVRNTANLRDKFDVIIFPPLNGTAQAIVNGIPLRGDPIPWKQSDLTQNMGLSPDQSDDIRGMGLPGMMNPTQTARP